MTCFTLVMNPGRSGSRFLFELIRQNFYGTCVVYHEALHADFTRPREFARAYDRQAVDHVLSIPKIRIIMDKWLEELELKHVVETGWTAAVLAPVMYSYFGQRFRVVLLHRHPVLFAASRSVMGNYSDAYQSDTHQQSPFDSISLHPEYQDRWETMCAFERCLFWWLEYTDMALEFIRKHSEVPHLVISSDDIFRNSNLRNQMLSFMGLDSSQPMKIPLRTNNIQKNRFSVETYPLGKEWRRYVHHPDVIARARMLGYEFDDRNLEQQLARYYLPNNLGARLRHYTDYHRTKRKIKNVLRWFEAAAKVKALY